MTNIETTQKALTLLALILATVFVGRSALAEPNPAQVQTQTSLFTQQR